jgi:alpha-L-rhamnosidase
LVLLFSLGVFASPAPLQPTSLKCENIENPLGIDNAHPRFSWMLASTGRNKFQSAYEIIVSNDETSISKYQGSVWTPGKIISAQQNNILYQGNALIPFTKYYWSVRVYDEEGNVSEWSKPSWFETAMLDASQWSAKWINDGSAVPAKDEDYYKDDPMPLLRKGFNVKEKIVSARLYISGLGYYEAYVNGKRVGDRELDPGFTTYGKEVLYSVYDITSLIKKGANAVGVMLGNGWYNPLPMRLFGRIDLRKYQQTGRPCLKAEIRIKTNSGSVVQIITDESWRATHGPILKNNVYLGESYDARNEIPHWNEAAFDDAKWAFASVVNGPGGRLQSEIIPPVRVKKVMNAVWINEVGKDTFIIDMGRNFAGVASISVHGPSGTKVKLRYGENIYQDGRLNYMTTVCTQLKKGVLSGGPGAPETAWQEDQYVLRGGAIETWHPRFTFHGFRYIEITGWPGIPTLNEIEGLQMHSDVEQVGTFECSNDLFNSIHRAVQWTFLSNLFSVQSDCPGREKMGYGADMVVTSDAFMLNYDMNNFYQKAVNDFANEQQPDGAITEMAPYMGIADKGYGGESGPLGWEIAYPFLQKKLFDYYGDSSVIRKNYSAVQKQIQFLQSKAIDGLFHWDISDHEALDPKPEAFSAAAFYYHHVLLAKEFAAILGRKDDSLKYAKLAQTIKNSIVRRYLVPGTGRFDNATQSAQEFALWYHLSPEPEKSFDQLLKEFERHDWHTASGIFGNKMMFDVLREFGRNDVAYRIANQKTFPGWGFMIENGATTLWETWAYPANFPSQNHPMFGSIDEWFYRSILGINGASAGFDSIIIKPQPVSELTWAKGEFKSVKGIIRSKWSMVEKKFHIEISIPPNSKARLEIPAKDGSTVLQDGKPVSNSNYKNGYVILQLGSGDYALETVLP